MYTALQDARQAAETVDVFNFLHSICSDREWHSYELSFGAPRPSLGIRQAT